jgi:hypothetical protein
VSIDRRQFLRFTAVGVLASLTAGACATSEAANARELAQPALLRMLGAERVRELGVRYRQMVPAENREAALRAALSHGEPRGMGFPWSARPSMAQLVEDDFANGRTVLVNGWVLSATEARQCALFSLQPA